MANEAGLELPPVREDASWSKLALFVGGLAVLSAVLASLAAFGARLGIWGFQTGFGLVRWAAYGALAAVLLGVLAAYLTRPGTARRGFVVALGAVLLAAITVGIPWRAHRASVSAPPINDITTDTENPPQFVAVAPLRTDAPNPIEYGGEEVARIQREAYPNIRPVILDLPQDRAFQRAFDVARAHGWEIVDASPEEGRIEATDRTFWFGFRDDIVVRLTPLDSRTVIDVRSSSRVGRGDAGTNARRVREYLDAVSG